MAVSNIPPKLAARPLPTGQRQLSATLWHCAAGPGDRPGTERHHRHVLAYVHRGGFGCHCRGRQFELAAGALFVGHPGDEYRCTHAHPGGDGCLSFGFDAELVAQLGGDARAWQCVAVPPLPALALLGELALAAADGRSDLALDEVGLMLGARFVALRSPATAAARAPTPAQRRRVARAAAWIDAHCSDAVDLDAAAAEAGCSRFHFLRLFGRIVGATPHQYLIRCRLRRAAQLLAGDAMPVTEVAYACGFGDLSNFVRTFGRAAGRSPGAYRRLARGRGR